MTSPPCPLVATGQQIGAGWSPALSVAKALAAAAEARRLGGQAVYWMADEDHDRLEVASTVGFPGRAPGPPPVPLPGPGAHRHRLAALDRGPAGAGRSPLGPAAPGRDPTLRGHALALGAPLWRRGLRPFSPTDPAVRNPIQGELERWRALDLETDLLRQAERLERSAPPCPWTPGNRRPGSPWTRAAGSGSGWNRDSPAPAAPGSARAPP